MNIYFNGDEHVSRSNGMAPSVAKLFNADYVNDAVNHSSVNQILRRTTDYINSCKQQQQWPDLMVIGFSNWDREDWFVNGQYQSSIDAGEANPQRYQYHSEYIAKNEPLIGALVKHYNNIIYNLHTELFYLGIPHLFFNCSMPLRCAKEMITFDWAGFYLKPYQLTFNYRNWCRYRGFQDQSPGEFDYGPEADQEWAKLLYDHIQQNNLLTKDEYGSLYNLGRQRRRHYGPRVGEWDEEFLRPSHI